MPADGFASGADLRLTRNMLVLGLALAFGAAYLGWFAYGSEGLLSHRLDGTLGILLGLYLGSHPAANMLEMLLFMKADAREAVLGSNRGRLWLLLNLLVGVMSWAVIFAATLRFVEM